MRDGFKGGMEIDEAVQVAKRLVQDRGSCVGAEWRFCKQSAYVCHAGSDAYKKYDTLYELLVAENMGVRMVGKWMIPTVPFKEAYFLEDALRFRTGNKGNSVSICGGGWYLVKR